jgi:hypothetical protein
MVSESKDVALPLAQEVMFPIFNKELATRVGKIFHQGWSKLEEM